MCLFFNSKCPREGLLIAGGFMHPSRLEFPNTATGSLKPDLEHGKEPQMKL
jgi:hypothetical protein